MRFENENRWLPEVGEASRLYNVPTWVIRTTIATESSYRPDAFNPGPPPSRGLMQLTETTARALGYDGDSGDDRSKTGGLYLPRTSILLGTKYLSQLRSRFPLDPWSTVYAAYNAGPDLSPWPSTAVAHWNREAQYFNPQLGIPEEPSRPFRRGPAWFTSPACCCCCGIFGTGGKELMNVPGVPKYEYRVELITPVAGQPIDPKALNAAGEQGFAVVGSAFSGDKLAVVLARVTGIIPLPGSGIVG